MSWDLSWIATTWIGAQQLGRTIPWAHPLFEAYVAGAWSLYWTEDTLYWIAKPVVHVEDVNGGRRLHCEDGAAVESDAENLYFWHGVLVPAFAVVRPDWITLDHIHHEENAEVRRVLLERFGFDRYIRDTGALPLHADTFGTLYRIELPGENEPLVVVSMLNSTPEPDGSRKQYVQRVEPELRPLPPGHWDADRKRTWLARQQPQALTARNAIASLMGLRGEAYAPVVET